MKNEINLLPPRKKRSVGETKDLKILRYLTVGSLITIVCLSVGAFMLTTFSPLPELQKEETQASSQLDNLRPFALKYLLLQKRLQSISALLQARLNYGTALESMESGQSDQVTFESISLKDRDVTLRASSKSLLILDALIQSLLQKTDSDKLYHNVVLSSTNYDPVAKTYKIAFTVTLR